MIARVSGASIHLQAFGWTAHFGAETALTNASLRATSRDQDGVPAAKSILSEIPLGDLSSGVHELSIAIPTAQPFSDSEMNFWNIAAYLTYEAH